MRRITPRKPAKHLARKQPMRTVEALEARLALDSTLVFNEIMYNPSGPADDELEWVELHNQMFVDLDISKWSVEGGVDFTFPEGTIVPEQGYLVIAADPQALRRASGMENAWGPFLGRLDNRGEELRLINNSGRLMNQVDYGDRGDWPDAADGSGSSLAKVSPSSASHVAVNWSFSTQVGGTPGAMNFAPAETLVSEEVLPKQTATRPLPLAFNEITAFDHDDFFVEIANDGPDSVDLGGIVLATIGETADEYTLPSQTLAPGGLLAINAQQLGWRPADNDLAALYTPDRGSVIDGRHVTGRLRGKSDAHHGDWLFPDSATPATPNVFDIDESIVINEIMYHGPTTAALPGQDPVYQSTPIVPMDSTWRYSKDFSLGAGDPPYDPGPNWEDTAHAVGFPNWHEGQAPIGYSSRRPEIRFNHSLVSPRVSLAPIVTYYFELEFGITAQQLGQFDDLVMRHLIDDGAIFYINGQEVDRFRMPDGVASADTLAAVNATDRIIVRESNSIPRDHLVALPAMNRISVEVHQGAIDSADVAFGLELLGRILRVPGTEDSPAIESAEEWLELYNRSQTETVDLGGWSFRRGIDYTFSENTTLAPGQHLVLAKDPPSLLAAHPSLAPDHVFGPYNGNLANEGELLELRDASNNPVDRVHYYDRGRCHQFADGGRSSLELIDPDSDNSIPESWAPSDETERSQWKTYQYVGPATNLGNDPELYNEFLFGLLAPGEFLIDDLSVVENSGTADCRQLIQNGTFQSDSLGGSPDKWRVIGTHHGTVVTDPDDATNHVLHVVATGPTEHMHNNAGTTLKAGNEFITIDGEATYEISFRAKWLAGSNQLHTRLYFNRLARKHLLDVPTQIGTPGVVNSMLAENIGPTYADFRHHPVVPEVDQAVTVTIVASDPEGVAEVTLWYSVNERDFVGVPMGLSDGGYSAQIPGQQRADLIQFYVSGTDHSGAVSTFPAAGPDSRAMYKVQDGRADLGNVLNFRLVMTKSDANFLHRTTNVMSNDLLRATVIFNEQDTYYDVGVRLKGAQRLRSNRDRVGYTVRFDPEKLYRGVQETVRVDRNGGRGTFQQKEMLVKHAIQHAGNIPGMYDDLVLVISPVPTSRSVSGMMLMSAYGDEFLDSQYENGSQGNSYEYELIYFPQTTIRRNDPESLKVPTPDETARVNLQLVQGFEDDVEAYRWHFLHDNNRDRDEFDQLISVLGALGQPVGDQFHEDTRQLIDVDQWLRAFAIITLFGVGDNYGTGAQHNASLYIRPNDGRMLLFPWDMDFAFVQAPTSGIVANSDLSSFLTDPNNEHAYFGHLHDIITTTFNNEYLDRWIDHYSEKVTQPFPEFKTYVHQRVESVTRNCGQLNSCLPREADFEITTRGPLDVGDDSTVTLKGRGWVDVRDIRLAGSMLPLDVNWTSVTRWEASIPVSQSRPGLQLVAYDFQGNVIDTASITVRSTATNPLTESLRITELHFNPAPPTVAEARSLPGVSNEDFEFIEVQNVGAETIELHGAGFADGIEFRFPTTRLLPGQNGVIVANLNAFRLRYGDDIAPLAQYDRQLSNGGERLTVATLDGMVVQDFAYDDWYFDADGLGSSLVIVDVGGDYDDVTNWRPSVTRGGSPGTAEPFIPQPGDANYDQRFNQMDLVLALQGGRYLSGERATWGQGDWNGDGVFDPLDVIAAMQTGAYSSAIPTAASRLAPLEQLFAEWKTPAQLF